MGKSLFWKIQSAILFLYIIIFNKGASIKIITMGYQLVTNELTIDYSVYKVLFLFICPHKLS